MTLRELSRTVDRPLVVPLMGYPGVQLTKSSIKQNGFNWGLHFWTIYELVKKFEPDAIFFMMDLSVEANALGLPVRFPLHESPSVEYPLVKKLDDLNQFLSLDILKDGRVTAFIETMKLMKKTIDIPKGGYVIGPFTLAGLMLGANDIAIATLDDKELVFKVLEFCTTTIIHYAKALVEAGADIIAILEPTAVILSPAAFWEFSGQFVKEIIKEISVIPILHVCGGASNLLDKMVLTGAEGLSLDSLVDFPTAAQKIPEDMFLIGNIDPVRVMRNGSPEEVKRKTLELLEKMRPYSNFILSTGCDLPPETPLENIAAFMEAGKSYRR